MKLRKHSQWTFRIVLGFGALIAVVLCIQSVRTYLYIGSVLIPQEANHEAQREASALSAAARNAGIDNPRMLASSLQHAIDSAENRVVWMRVLDLENNILSQAGSYPTISRIPPHWWDRTQKHENPGIVINTPSGKALSIILPLRMPRRSHLDDRHMGYVLDLGISLTGVAERFAGLRENVIVGMIASIALLVSLAVIGLRAHLYLRGRYLESELQLARRVQSDLQPKTQLLSPHVEFAASAIAADHVGGDFYDIFELESGQIAIVVGDVSGKGVPAALLVSMLQGAIRSSTTSQPEFACERINRMLCERTANERFATLFWAVFDPESRTLRYVNAGHAAPMLLSNDRNLVHRLSEGGPLLGCLPNAQYSAGEVEITDCDALILYTDGVSEAANEGGEEFGEERILQTVSRARGFAAARLCDEISRKVTAFSGAQGSIHDDRTLLVVEFLACETSSREYKCSAAIAL